MCNCQIGKWLASHQLTHSTRYSKRENVFFSGAGSNLGLCYYVSFVSLNLQQFLGLSLSPMMMISQFCRVQARVRFCFCFFSLSLKRGLPVVSSLDSVCAIWAGMLQNRCILPSAPLEEARHVAGAIIDHFNFDHLVMAASLSFVPCKFCPFVLSLSK